MKTSSSPPTLSNINIARLAAELNSSHSSAVNKSSLSSVSPKSRSVPCPLLCEANEVKLSPRTQNFAKKNHKEKIVDEGRLEVPIPQISPTLHLKWSDTPSPSPDKDKAKGKVTEVSVINDSTFETDSPESSTPVAKSAVRHSFGMDYYGVGIDVEELHSLHPGYWGGGSALNGKVSSRPSMGGGFRPLPDSVEQSSPRLRSSHTARATYESQRRAAEREKQRMQQISWENSNQPTEEGKYPLLGSVDILLNGVKQFYRETIGELELDQPETAAILKSPVDCSSKMQDTANDRVVETAASMIPRNTAAVDSSVVMASRVEEVVPADTNLSGDDEEKKRWPRSTLHMSISIPTVPQLSADGIEGVSPTVRSDYGQENRIMSDTPVKLNKFATDFESSDAKAPSLSPRLKRVEYPRLALMGGSKPISSSIHNPAKQFKKAPVYPLAPRDSLKASACRASPRGTRTAGSSSFGLDMEALVQPLQPPSLPLQGKFLEIGLGVSNPETTSPNLRKINGKQLLYRRIDSGGNATVAFEVPRALRQEQTPQAPFISALDAYQGSVPSIEVSPLPPTQS